MVEPNDLVVDELDDVDEPDDMDKLDNVDEPDDVLVGNSCDIGTDIALLSKWKSTKRLVPIYVIIF